MHRNLNETGHFLKKLSDIKTIKSILASHGFSFSKALGQNFIIDPEVCPKISESAGLDKNTAVIEIGAGIGVLTAELALRAGKVIAFELDRRLIPILKETLGAFDNIEIINEDIMKADLRRLINEKCGGMRVAVVANIPYNITSPLIMMLLEGRLGIDTITVMVQSEAAKRLCAPVGSREGGSVTVAVNYYANAKRLFPVSRTSFLPPPKVDSEVIELQIRKAPPVTVDEKVFFKLVKGVFSQRRKTLLNSLESALSIPKAQTAKALSQMGLSKDIRPERLTMEDFARLSKALFN
ncbi:MAG: Ribosomal RNA small subunit methyltransferase A [Firmicutes bacterium ADurb.Bin300]|nr:MAG: Ribosomal RNA small subunit methyltransferase A [Firmicutes bacterium ADurb.Bin300]